MRAAAFASLLCLLTGSAQALDVEADRLARAVLDDGPARRPAFDAIVARGRPDMVGPLLDLMRFFPPDPRGFGATLERLTGAAHGTDWAAWMLWQEERPELRAYDGYAAFKADTLALIDPDFRVFFRPAPPPRIRLEEVVWGGVAKDGIPALVNPAMVTAGAATWLEPDEWVFGVALNGDVRAYPFRVMDWHEMANDVVGGVPAALAYCTLCGSGILYDTRRPDGEPPLVFGSSGLLYRSNKLMYDQATHSLWNQFTGRPVVGPLTDSGIELPVLPLTVTSWADWRERHPDTKVLSLDTGHERDYRPGRPYGAYFASPDLMFPAKLPDPSLPAKEVVFVLRAGGGEQAWPLSSFIEQPVRNERLGDLSVVLIGDPATRTVRAYERRDLAFTALPGRRDLVAADSREWRIEEEALVSADGTTLPRLPGHLAYWFAFSNYHPDKAAVR
jgi:hypothetical protein